MEIGILGPFRLVGDDGQERRAAARQRQLLALLAWHAGHVLSRDRLIDALWGEQLPANPGNALQQRIFHARKLLDLAGGDELLVTSDAGYRLVLPRDRVDAHCFQDRCARAQRERSDGELGAARDTLGAALDLWRGDPLQDVEAPWVASVVRRLEDDRLAAMEERIELGLALGRHAEVVGPLEALVGDHPLHERLRGQLMRALAGIGRQAEALEVFTTTRELLAEELGIDPSPALQRVHADVLSQRGASTDGDAATARPRSVSPASRAPVARLPAATSSFIGREAEVQRLRELLATDRIVTVTGPGGAGKTRLAIETARTMPDADDVVLVELDSVTDPDAVPAVVATTLGVTAEPGSPLVTSLGVALRSRRFQLVLDNCEHIVDAVAELVATLTGTCPELRILATSREPLGIDGEVVWPLDPLAVPPADTEQLASARRSPAVQLFLDRITAVAPDHSPDDVEVAAIVRIVRDLDGLPLAIELAASRARAMPLGELAERLGDRFALLSGGRRDSPTRHRALTATLDWSWGLLDQDSRSAWMAAAVPAGPFTADLLSPLLAAVAPHVEVFDAITSLCDRSLLRVERDAAAMRYTMLSTVREYGLHRLEETDAAATVRRAHADAVEAAVAAADRTTTASWDVDFAVQRRLLPEVRAALRWREQQGDRRGMQRLVCQLGWLGFLTSLTSEVRRLLDLAVEPMGGVDGDIEPDAALWAAALRLGDADAEGAAWAARALELAGDDPLRRVLAHGFVAAYLTLEGRVNDALELIERETRVGGWLDGLGRVMEGKLRTFLGDLDGAQDTLAIAQQLIDGAGELSGLLAGDVLVILAQLRGDAEGVRRAARRGIAAAEHHGTAELEIELRCLLAMVEAAAGDAEVAAAELAAAHELAHRQSPAMSAALLANTEAYTRWRRGDHDGALQWWTETLDLHDWTGLAFGRPFALWGLGHLALERGELDAAAGYLHAALEEAVARGDRDATAAALEGAAALEHARGEHERAARVLGAADGARRAMGARRPVMTGDLAAATREALRASLGDDLMASAHEAGARDLDGVIAQLTEAGRGVATHAGVR